MQKYRIYTERKHVKDVCRIVSEYFSGFTVFKTVGYWQGRPEKSMVIEIGVPEDAEVYANTWRIKELCQKIKGLNRQDAVLLTKVRVQTEMIT